MWTHIVNSLAGLLIYVMLAWAVLKVCQKVPRGGREPSDYLPQKCETPSDERDGPGSPRGPL